MKLDYWQGIQHNDLVLHVKSAQLYLASFRDYKRGKIECVPVSMIYRTKHVGVSRITRALVFRLNPSELVKLPDGEKSYVARKVS